MSRVLSSNGRIVIVEPQLAVFARVLVELLADLRKCAADFTAPVTFLAQLMPRRLPHGVGTG